MSKKNSKGNASPFQDLLLRSTREARKSFSQYGRAMFVEPQSGAPHAEFEAFVQTLTRSCFVGIRSLQLASKAFDMDLEQVQALRQLVLHAVVKEISESEGTPAEVLAEMSGLDMFEESADPSTKVPLALSHRSRLSGMENKLSRMLH